MEPVVNEMTIPMNSFPLMTSASPVRFHMLGEGATALHIFHPTTLRWNAAVFMPRAGGWRGDSDGDMRVLHPLAAALAADGLPVAVADFPSDASDAFAQVAALRKAARRFLKYLASCGMVSPHLLLFGMGAGAHLGGLMACTEGDEEVAVSAACLLSCPVQFTPWPELFPRTWAQMQDIAGKPYTPESETYRSLSLTSHLDRMPPLLLAEGEQDHIGTAAASKKFAAALTATGREAHWKMYPLGGPSFISMIDWKPSRMLLDDMRQFFKAHAESEPPQATFPSASEAYGLYLDDPPQSLRGVDIFLPAKELDTIDTALLIIHGGGWRYGDRIKLDGIAEAFARRGVVTASAGYRLQARDAFEQLADVREGYMAFAEELRRLGRPVRIAVYGESAGAHLASLLASTPSGGCGEKCRVDLRAWVPPVAMILQSAPAQFTPWPDISPAIWSIMEDVAGAAYAEDPERYKRLSFNNYVSASVPPVFFSEAQFESIFPQEMTRALGDELARHGVAVTTKRYNAEHGFFYALDDAVQREFFKDILAWLKGLA